VANIVAGRIVFFFGIAQADDEFHDYILIYKKQKTKSHLHLPFTREAQRQKMIAEKITSVIARPKRSWRSVYIDIKGCTKICIDTLIYRKVRVNLNLTCG
jgi:hypothetical protein